MTEFNTAVTDVNSMVNEYERLMQSVRETLQSKIKDLFTAFFNSHPTVQTIHWTQYAPHFNDGDECVFSVHEPSFTTTTYDKLTEREHAWGEEDCTIVTSRYDRELRKWVATDIDPDLKRDMDTFSSIIQSDANEDVFRAMFGTSVWVKAHRDGFEVDDYDHD